MTIAGTRTVFGRYTSDFDSNVEDACETLSALGYTVLSINPFFQPETDDAVGGFSAVIVFGEPEDGDA